MRPIIKFKANYDNGAKCFFNIYAHGDMFKVESTYYNREGYYSAKDSGEYLINYGEFDLICRRVSGEYPVDGKNPFTPLSA